MIYLRVRAKQLQRRELAESVEDARIFASANRIVDGGFPQPQMNGHGKETTYNSSSYKETTSSAVQEKVGIIIKYLGFDFYSNTGPFKIKVHLVCSAIW